MNAVLLAMHMNAIRMPEMMYSRVEVSKSFVVTSRNEVVNDQRSDELLRRYLRTLTPEQRRKYLASAIGNHIYIDCPEFWAIADADTTLRAVYSMGEPLSASMIAALEKWAPSYKANNALLAYAWLYRYNRPVGYQGLLKLASAGDSQAASILSDNREQSALPVILRVLDSNIDNGQLVRSLGKWHDVQIIRALLNEYKKHPHNFNLALALANQNCLESVQYTRSLYFSSDNNSIAKYCAGLALIKLDGPKAKNILVNISKIAVTPSQNLAILQAVLDAVKYLKVSEFVRPTVKIITKLDNSPKSLRNESNLQVAVLGFEVFGSISVKTQHGFVLRVLKELAANDDVDATYLDRIGKSALMMGVSYEELLPELGRNWVDRQERLKDMNLKYLPYALLPQESPL